MNDIRSQIFGGKQRDPQLLGKKRPRGAKAAAGLQSVAVPRAETRTSDGREADRHRLSDEQVKLTHRGADIEVELINVSAGGAMVSGPAFAPQLWDSVQLHFGDDASLDCVVRWLKNGRVGLQFSPETQVDCSQAELHALLRSVIARSFPELGIDLSPATEQSPAPSTEAAPEREHRQERRLPLIWLGAIHYDFASTPVRLRNISSTGALVECDFPLPVGAEPLLDLGESGTVFATVTWRRDNQIGLQFKEPFDLSQLSRSRPEVAPVWSARQMHDQATGDEEQLSPAQLKERLESFLSR